MEVVPNSSRKDDAGGVVRKRGAEVEVGGAVHAQVEKSEQGRTTRMRPDGRSYCSSPLHQAHTELDLSTDHSQHTGPVFFRPLEERITWERTVAGVSIGGEVPLLWRGCSYGCLDYLDTDGVAASRSARPSLDAGRGDVSSRFDSPGWGRLPNPSHGLGMATPGQTGRGDAGQDEEEDEVQRELGVADPQLPIPRPLFGPGGRRAGYGSDDDDDESMEGSFTDSDVFSGED